VNDSSPSTPQEAQPQTARDLVRLIKDGALSSVDLTKLCFEIIDSNDSNIGAWEYLDREQVLAQAENMDGIRKRGEPTGKLHGIPIGIKDIFDTTDQPTQLGSSIFADRQPELDCAVVERLKEAGAVIMGKTTTTEFAFMHPSTTKHPANPLHTPGGSSSGSAAAVAAGHVPLAVGSQTNGSVIRPASFCGVYGYKPSRGIISRRGALQTSETLDHVGVFGRDVADIALMGDALGAYDHLDTASYLHPRPALLAGYESEVPAEPALVWIDMPYAGKYSEDAAAGFEELLEVLGNKVERVPAPQSFAALIPCHNLIHEYEITRQLNDVFDNHWDAISDTIKPVIERGRKHSDESYQEALEIRTASKLWFKEFFNDYDAILTPSALGEAPLIDSGGTGDPVCCTIWTLCGLPCLNLPLLTGNNGLPIGVQLVGSLNEDDRLFRTARHFLAAIHKLMA